ncbi:hypothetical protein KUF71_001432, partial [Frankliniella fusca]
EYGGGRGQGSSAASTPHSTTGGPQGAAGAAGAGAATAASSYASAPGTGAGGGAAAMGAGAATPGYATASTPQLTNLGCPSSGLFGASTKMGSFFSSSFSSMNPFTLQT